MAETALISSANVAANATAVRTANLLPADASPLSFQQGHIEFVEFQQSYVSQYISLADTKAVWTFALSGGVIGYLLSDEQLRNYVLHPTWSAATVLMSSVLSLLSMSSLCSFLVIAPRLGTSEGLVFFRSVAAHESAELFSNLIANTSQSELMQARLKHTYDLSRVCTRKYDYLLKAMWLGLPALFGAGLTLLLKP